MVLCHQKMDEGELSARRQGVACALTRSGRRALIALLSLCAVLPCQSAQGQTTQPAAKTPVDKTQPLDPSLASPEGERQYIDVGIDDRVTMHVSNLPLAEALRMLSEPTRKNIILARDVKGAVSASIYNATFEEALQAVLVSNSLGYRVENGFIYVLPLDDLAKMTQASRKLVTRVYELNYANAAAAKELITPLLSKDGRVAVTPPSAKGLGGAGSAPDTEGNATVTNDTLIITDYEEKVAQIVTVLKQLDQRPKQVLIEATILRATLNDDNALGIDFTTVGGVDFAELNSISPAAQSVTTGVIPNADLNNTNFTVRTELNNKVPNGGFTFGILKDQVGVFIRALESITETNIIANPKILALNKQAGQVIVGRRDGYITTTITETTAVQKVEFLETGTLLTIRPFIGDDGYVRMEIHPKDSTGGLTATNLPFEQTTEVTTNVMVKDGHTILIGGLFREVSTTSRDQMPGLGNLPIAGALFRTTRDNTVREEVIVLLTVHVVKGNMDTDASEKLSQDVERYRVGMRKGMQWFGRERLAQAHYTWAMEHLAKGDLNLAIWDTELAINNNPRNIDAIKLLETLRHKREWDADGSAVREFVRNRILEEEGIKMPAFGRPGPPFQIPGEIEGETGFENDADAQQPPVPDSEGSVK